MQQLDLEAHEYPELPPEGVKLWETYIDMRYECGDGMGDTALTSGMILDWCKLTRTVLRPWQVTAIRRLARESRFEPKTLREMFNKS